MRISGLAGGKDDSVITYSIDKAADVTVRKEGISQALDGIDVTYNARGADVTVRLNTIGPCNISNGAAAIAASLALGASVKDMEEGLSGFSPLGGRMEVVRINGVTILDDTYNANPDSVAAALKTLKAAGGRKVAVLGDMLELGEASAPSHREIGALAAALSVDILVAIGLWSKETTEGALSSLRYSGRQASGLGESSVRGFGEKKEAALYLNGILKKGDTVLIKGSRAVGLETIVEGLKNGPQFVLA
ncbi:MAG: hypothetical protein HZB21_07505 [Deltaproteobacteria bacterium]|nr:hypothetical protein [Deltaproteobacteria bacterium]